MPIALARQLKQMSFAQSDQVSMQLAIDGGRLTVLVRSGQEITDAQLSALPRGALTEDAARVPVQLTVRQEYGARGTEQIAAGAVPVAALAEAAQPLLRLVVTLTSGERVSRTWNWDELVGRRR